MDCRSGDIYSEEVVEKLIDQMPEVLQDFKQVFDNTFTPVQKTQLAAVGHTKIAMNDPCPCGSDLNFRVCCFKRSK